MEITIDTPNFDYLKFGGAELSSVTYTFDVDTQSELYRFIKTRLLKPNSQITIVLK